VWFSCTKTTTCLTSAAMLSSLPALATKSKRGPSRFTQ